MVKEKPANSIWWQVSLQSFKPSWEHGNRRSAGWGENHYFCLISSPRLTWPVLRRKGSMKHILKELIAQHKWNVSVTDSWGGIKNWPNRAVKRRTSLLPPPLTDPLKVMELYNTSTNTNIKLKILFFSDLENWDLKTWEKRFGFIYSQNMKYN